MDTCTSCGKNLDAEEVKVSFKCPSCGKGTIGRCERCKKLGRAYACSECGFKGP